jgi:hemolysin-activating ACP:hemolysin acyltransferase
MQGPATQEPANGNAIASSGYLLYRPPTPAAALGMAVNYLMTKPAFAQLRFGEWSRILVGQINRKHYCFVIDENKQIQGFLGWALTSKEKAEAWVENRGAVSGIDANDGDCVIFNAWAANHPRINRVLLDAARQVMQGRDTMYFKRHYKDGTTRPVRMRINDFVTQHLERDKQQAA